MELLLLEFMGKPVWTWLAFFVAIGLLLAFDLGVLHRKSHAIGVGESLGLSAFYIAIGRRMSYARRWPALSRRRSACSRKPATRPLRRALPKSKSLSND